MASEQGEGKESEMKRALCLMVALMLMAPAYGNSIVSWGCNSAYQVGQTPNETDFQAIAGGGGHSLALKVDGSIVSWGDDGDD